MAWRFIASRLNGDGTETFLDYDLPIAGAEINRELSGPGGITGTIAPEIAQLVGEDGEPILVPWSTVIYAEENGVIRDAAILESLTENGPVLDLDAVGFTGYAKDEPYTGVYTTYRTDPLTIVRHVWSHIQDKKGANLGVEVDALSATPVRLGIPEDPKLTAAKSAEGSALAAYDQARKAYNASKTAANKLAMENAKKALDKAKDETSKIKDGAAKPYALNWWEHFDLGGELDTLAADTPFDYRMDHSWEDRAQVDEAFNLAYMGGTTFHTAITGSTYTGGPRGTTVAKGVRTTSGATAIYLMRTARPSVTPGSIYTATAMVRVSVAGTYNLRLAFNGLTGGVPSQGYALNAGQWTKLSITAAIPSDVTSTGLDLLDPITRPVGATIEITEPTLTLRDQPIENYGDGNMPGWEWLGTPGSSASRRLPVSPGGVKHFLRFGYPMLGHRRHDLRFMVGENVYEVPTIERDGDDYADTVIVLGAGEGRKMVRATASKISDRLHRTKIHEDKSIRTAARAQRLADSLLALYSGDEKVLELEVVDHPNARLGSYDVGDEILIQHPDGWGNGSAVWSRIISISFHPESGSASLELLPA